MMSCGFSSIELIMKAASQSSFTPFSEKEAAMGMVPYMQRGDAMPSRLAGITPKAPSFPLPRASQAEAIFPLPKTEIAEPRKMPSTK